jgi:predicted metal-dependent hydrolase
MNTVTTKEGVQICFTLQRKNVKNINLRIHRDGSISVSAARSVPLSRIEDFVLQNSERILACLEKFSKAKPPSYRDGEKVSILGRTLTIRTSGDGRCAFVSGDELVVPIRAQHESEIEKYIDKLKKKICEENVLPLCRMHFSYFEERGIPFPQIKFKKMKSRWGSCNKGTGVVCFSSHLASLPTALIELVVVHELAHLIQADHSRQFYALLSKLLPDHEERRKALKGYTML